MNPYQRINRGSIHQKGHIDTAAKFAQLTAGVDLTGKSVLDVGCNLGEMCRLAKEAGAAVVRGVDCEPEYIYDARKIAPDDGIIYDCKTAYNIAGNWDIIIASACLHYMDIDRALAQFARCGKMVLCDVWMEIVHGPDCFLSSDRGLFIPSASAWGTIACRHFDFVMSRGAAISPDMSSRYAYMLRSPKPSPARAVLFYGNGSTGKTSRGRDLRYGKGYEHLEIDSIFLAWKMEMEPRLPMSVMDFVDGLWRENNPARVSKYLAYYNGYIDRWLGSRQNLDVVIEGYDACNPIFRGIVHEALDRNGWIDIHEEECK